MLPTFQIRGLRFCATDSLDLSDDSFSELEALHIHDDARASTSRVAGGAEGGPVGQGENWADVQLEKKEQYDEIIKDHPEAQLAYVDEDDGDMITVCSLSRFTMFFALLTNVLRLARLMNYSRG